MDLDVWGAPIVVVLLATISGLYIVLSDKKEDTLKDATNNDLAVKKGQIMEPNAPCDLTDRNKNCRRAGLSPLNYTRHGRYTRSQSCADHHCIMEEAYCIGLTGG